MQTNLGAKLTIEQPILDNHTQNKQLKKQKCEQFFFKKKKVVSKSTSTKAFRDYKQDERISSQRTLKFQECMKYITYN
jgi:tRNA A-37 threonylcarbamoyl transferase component Bud32